MADFMSTRFRLGAALFALGLGVVGVTKHFVREDGLEMLARRSLGDLVLSPGLSIVLLLWGAGGLAYYLLRDRDQGA